MGIYNKKINIILCIFYVPQLPETNHREFNKINYKFVRVHADTLHTIMRYILWL